MSAFFIFYLTVTAVVRSLLAIAVFHWGIIVTVITLTTAVI